MLQIKNIKKKYVTGELTQIALNDVSMNLRDSEFVAVLGASGSGKTTMLNIIGGLDRYDEGDLVINSISTKKYKDRDWDSYRNHTIGFVFQSYNLIPHQSVLSNVELALTISGISKKERKQRAIKALEEVGLGEQIHKKPNQMSGGQMQRVAIARALVNNPDILLADEPTGALDSETSIQVMELLKEVAKDRLVIMVTHNPELAEEYASRIIKLKDGKMVDDSNPYVVSEEIKEPEHKNMGKASMSFLTALSLSFNNLKTKKARTILTSFAGSIGIIGIALILSLSNGVSTYIKDIQRDTMTSYPITIDAQTIDFMSMMQVPGSLFEEKHENDKIYSNSMELEGLNQMMTSVTKNNLSNFKKYLDDVNSEINQYIGGNGVVYSYNVVFDIFGKNTNGDMVSLSDDPLNPESMAPTPSDSSPAGEMQLTMMSNMTNGVFDEMLADNKNNSLVSNVITDNYDIVSGKWPDKSTDMVLVLNNNNELSISTLYSLGLLPADDFDKIMDSIDKKEEIEVQEYSYSYDEILDKTFYLVPGSDFFTKGDDGLFTQKDNKQETLQSLTDDAMEVSFSAIIKGKKDADMLSITGDIGYTKALADEIIDYCNNSEIVKAQQDSKDINVLNGLKFAPDSDAEKANDAKNFISSMTISEKAEFWSEMAKLMYATDPEMQAQLAKMTETELAAATDMFLMQPNEQILVMFYDSYISTGTYEENLNNFGFVSYDAPTQISIYADTFEGKEGISASIENYNKEQEEVDQIVYNDLVGMMTSSMVTIINVITYVLVAFVAVSLVVSSIMIGIITYISVLERTKEIGVLRAIGASKKNVSQVFNAETFIIGLLSGLIGVLVCCLMLLPANAIIHLLVGSNDVSASLPVVSAITLILLSIALTWIGGLIPSKTAAKKDPVLALRTE